MAATAQAHRLQLLLLFVSALCLVNSPVVHPNGPKGPKQGVGSQELKMLRFFTLGMLETAWALGEVLRSG